MSKIQDLRPKIDTSKLTVISKEALADALSKSGYTVGRVGRPYFEIDISEIDMAKCQAQLDHTIKELGVQ